MVWRRVNINYRLECRDVNKFAVQSMSFQIETLSEFSTSGSLVTRVFGELMYLLEYRDQTIKLAGGQPFYIPQNVYILGTMNTADRSIALVDHALRRRFA